MKTPQARIFGSSIQDLSESVAALASKIDRVEGHLKRERERNQMLVNRTRWIIWTVLVLLLVTLIGQFAHGPAAAEEYHAAREAALATPVVMPTPVIEVLTPTATPWATVPERMVTP